MLRPVADILADCNPAIYILDTEEFGLFVSLRAREFTNAVQLLSEVFLREADIIAYLREHRVGYHDYVHPHDSPLKASE